MSEKEIKSDKTPKSYEQFSQDEISPLENISIIDYSDGTYHGEVVNDMRQGLGVYFWNCGDVYYGQWNNDNMHGKGYFYFAYGGFIQGEFQNGKLDGGGHLYFPNGDFQKGFWKQGQLNGKGVRYLANIEQWTFDEYSNGRIVKNLSSGNGKPVQFEISIHNDEMDYFSRIFKEDNLQLYQNLYEGQMYNESKEGAGSLYFRDGSRYQGIWASDLPNGIGIFYYNDGKIDSGFYRDGLLHGIGRTLFTNGDSYYGSFFEGKFNGSGIYYSNTNRHWNYAIFKDNILEKTIISGSSFPSPSYWDFRTDLQKNLKPSQTADYNINVVSLNPQDNQILCKQPNPKSNQLNSSFNSSVIDKIAIRNYGNLKTVCTLREVSGPNNEVYSELVSAVNENIEFKRRRPLKLLKKDEASIYDLFYITSSNNHIQKLLKHILQQQPVAEEAPIQQDYQAGINTNQIVQSEHIPNNKILIGRPSLQENSDKKENLSSRLDNKHELQSPTDSKNMHQPKQDQNDTFTQQTPNYNQQKNIGGNQPSSSRMASFKLDNNTVTQKNDLKQNKKNEGNQQQIQNDQIIQNQKNKGADSIYQTPLTQEPSERYSSPQVNLKGGQRQKLDEYELKNIIDKLPEDKKQTIQNLKELPSNKQNQQKIDLQIPLQNIQTHLSTDKRGDSQSSKSNKNKQNFTSPVSYPSKDQDQVISNNSQSDNDKSQLSKLYNSSQSQKDNKKTDQSKSQPKKKQPKENTDSTLKQQQQQQQQQSTSEPGQNIVKTIKDNNPLVDAIKSLFKVNEQIEKSKKKDKRNSWIGRTEQDNISKSDKNLRRKSEIKQNVKQYKTQGSPQSKQSQLNKQIPHGDYNFLGFSEASSLQNKIQNGRTDQGIIPTRINLNRQQDQRSDNNNKQSTSDYSNTNNRSADTSNKNKQTSQQPRKGQSNKNAGTAKQNIQQKPNQFQDSSNARTGQSQSKQRPSSQDKSSFKNMLQYYQGTDKSASENDKSSQSMVKSEPGQNQNNQKNQAKAYTPKIGKASNIDQASYSFTFGSTLKKKPLVQKVIDSKYKKTQQQQQDPEKILVRNVYSNLAPKTPSTLDQKSKQKTQESKTPKKTNQISNKEKQRIIKDISEKLKEIPSIKNLKKIKNKNTIDQQTKPKKDKGLENLLNKVNKKSKSDSQISQHGRSFSEISKQKNKKQNNQQTGQITDRLIQFSEDLSKDVDDEFLENLTNLSEIEKLQKQQQATLPYFGQGHPSSDLDNLINNKNKHSSNYKPEQTQQNKYNISTQQSQQQKDSNSRSAKAKLSPLNKPKDINNNSRQGRTNILNQNSDSNYISDKDRSKHASTSPKQYSQTSQYSSRNQNQQNSQIKKTSYNQQGKDTQPQNRKNSKDLGQSKSKYSNLSKQQQQQQQQDLISNSTTISSQQQLTNNQGQKNNKNLTKEQQEQLKRSQLQTTNNQGQTNNQSQKQILGTEQNIKNDKSKNSSLSQQGQQQQQRESGLGQDNKNSQNQKLSQIRDKKQNQNYQNNVIEDNSSNLFPDSQPDTNNNKNTTQQIANIPQVSSQDGNNQQVNEDSNKTQNYQQNTQEQYSQIAQNQNQKQYENKSENKIQDPNLQQQQQNKVDQQPKQEIKQAKEEVQQNLSEIHPKQQLINQQQPNQSKIDNQGVVNQQDFINNPDSPEKYQNQTNKIKSELNDESQNLLKIQQLNELKEQSEDNFLKDLQQKHKDKNKLEKPQNININNEKEMNNEEIKLLNQQNEFMNFQIIKIQQEENPIKQINPSESQLRDVLRYSFNQDKIPYYTTKQFVNNRNEDDNHLFSEDVTPNNRIDTNNIPQKQDKFDSDDDLQKQDQGSNQYINKIDQSIGGASQKSHLINSQQGPNIQTIPSSSGGISPNDDSQIIRNSNNDIGSPSQQQHNTITTNRKSIKSPESLKDSTTFKKIRIKDEIDKLLNNINKNSVSSNQSVISQQDDNHRINSIQSTHHNKILNTIDKMQNQQVQVDLSEAEDEEDIPQNFHITINLEPQFVQGNIEIISSKPGELVYRIPPDEAIITLKTKERNENGELVMKRIRQVIDQNTGLQNYEEHVFASPLSLRKSHAETMHSENRSTFRSPDYALSRNSYKPIVQLIDHKDDIKHNVIDIYPQDINNRVQYQARNTYYYETPLTDPQNYQKTEIYNQNPSFIYCSTKRAYRFNLNSLQQLQ